MSLHHIRFLELVTGMGMTANPSLYLLIHRPQDTQCTHLPSMSQASSPAYSSDI